MPTRSIPIVIGTRSSELGRTWDETMGCSRLGWEHAKLAARDAWDRVERALSGDADNDGTVVTYNADVTAGLGT
jgi:hypothetical protein